MWEKVSEEKETHKREVIGFLNRLFKVLKLKWKKKKLYLLVERM